MADAKLPQRALNAALKRLAAEAYTVEDDGTVVTKADALARLIWAKALGWVQTTTDDHGNRIRKDYPPEAWAMQYIFERIEGKSAPVIQEPEIGVRASDKVRQLAKDRLNKLANVAAGPPKGKI